MLLTRLRTETRAAHDRIESDLDMLGPGLTLERYGALVARFHAFFRIWEPRIGELVGDEAFFGPRRKLPLLEADLAALGLAPLRQTPRIPRLDDVEEAMGSLYVLEGSTMGGQVIAKSLERRLGLAGPGATYFASYGRDVAARWRAFQDILASLSSPAADDRIVCAALATFESLQACLFAPARTRHG
ncbi:biliverdin-producing heme oxygenase [Alsobacter sp. KACC 23698]|uniref:Biliverdin-producing heme oxygenase n=1 Tax=Alsobacter sp. KACC 23698 TaxID=3149229 RepID=A0AAU7JBE5_9HYPH